MDAQRSYEFGPFRLDLSARRLLRDGEETPLKPKAFDMLVILVENNQRVVEKEELMRLLWPDIAVEENNLTVHKSALNKALGEGYIQTVQRRGYRFAADVREIPPTMGQAGLLEESRAAPENRANANVDERPGSEQMQAAPTGKSGGARQSRRWLLAALSLTAIGALGAVIFWRGASETGQQSRDGRTLVRSPSDEAEVMRVVKESQVYETLGIYTNPEAFDRSQMNRYWLPVEQGGKAIPPIEASVARLRKNGWRYSSESRLEIFDFRYVRVFSPRDYAEAGTSERWFVPTVRADGSRVENRNVYLGVYDVDYTLRKVDGRWLIEENSTPRPTSGGNRNN